MSNAPIVIAGFREVKSPRLKWMEKHGITLSGSGKRFHAQMGAILGIGATEHDALADLCERRNKAYSKLPKLHLWFEEECAEQMAAKGKSV